MSAAAGRPLELRFVMSAPSLDSLPPTTAEVAVAGRSNVGKSSLINALANRRKLAEVSKTPGRTRLLNLFAVTDGNSRTDDDTPRAALVDLPGYGYANVPANVKATWAAMIEGYLLGREQLRCVLVLVDGAVGPTRLDIDMLDWVRHHDVEHLVVATKDDKVKASKRTARRRELVQRCGVDHDDVMWVSAASGTGIDALRTKVRALLR